MEHGLPTGGIDYDKQRTLLECEDGVVLKIKERDLLLLTSPNTLYLYNVLIYKKEDQKEKFVGEISALDKHKKFNIIFYDKKINRFGEIGQIAMKGFLHCIFLNKEIPQISNNHISLDTNKNETREDFIKFYENCGFEIDQNSQDLNISQELNMICTRENFYEKFPEFLENKNVSNDNQRSFSIDSNGNSSGYASGDNSSPSNTPSSLFNVDSAKKNESKFKF